MPCRPVQSPRWSSSTRDGGRPRLVVSHGYTPDDDRAYDLTRGDHEATHHPRFIGAVDWDQRLFDSLIPLPDGTSYNCYLVAGSGEDGADRHRGPVQGRRAARAVARRVRGWTTSSSTPRRAGPLGLDPDGARPVPGGDAPRLRPRRKDMLVDLLGIAGADSRPWRTARRFDLGGKTLQFIDDAMGPLAGDDGHVPRRRTGSCFVRPLRLALATSDLYASADQAAVVRGREALLRRDHDALPHGGPEERGKVRRGGQDDRAQPRTGVRRSPPSSSRPTRTGPAANSNMVCLPVLAVDDERG